VTLFHRQSQAGFTLIEIMIVVAILGILASIAYSSYQNQVMRSNRSDAQATLNDTAQRLQRCYTTFSSYDNDNCAVYQQLTTGDARIDSPEGMYRITIDDESATTYTLSATAIRAPQTADEDCDTEMSLDHRGRRTPEACW
jgi:type IV pilus assembly protein PilE|tara:strand:+ start:340 stop:762 length:423 start_codon:yes stop_codon:yes gene_type:complete